jgi:hypothetical protein
MTPRCVTPIAMPIWRSLTGSLPLPLSLPPHTHTHTLFSSPFPSLSLLYPFPDLSLPPSLSPSLPLSLSPSPSPSPSPPSLSVVEHAEWCNWEFTKTRMRCVYPTHQSSRYSHQHKYSRSPPLNPLPLPLLLFLLLTPPLPLPLLPCYPFRLWVTVCIFIRSFNFPFTLSKYIFFSFTPSL